MGPFGRFFAQIGLTVVTTFGKAFGKAFKEQAQQQATKAATGAGARAGTAAADSSRSWGGRLMPPDEAYRVLNVDPKSTNPQEQITQNFDRLFKLNDVTSGGSFYLQSKVFRAKQTLDRIHPPSKASPSADAASPSQSSSSASSASS